MSRQYFLTRKEEYSQNPRLNESKMSKDSRIKHNIRVHNKIYRKYATNHKEIFNPSEQQRLQDTLKRATGFIQTAGVKKSAIDIGCGTGNLTYYLVNMRMKTFSADVSEKFLSIVKERFSDSGMVETIKLNGEDLSEIQNEEYDFAGVYSVLHHIPDYLALIKEMVRVLKPGGVLYIDHEAAPSYWQKDKLYKEYTGHFTRNLRQRLKNLFRPSYYITTFRRMMNSRYQPEGDIHVFEDDHIEWDKIEYLLNQLNCDIVLKEDYLLCRGVSSYGFYTQYKDKCADTRVLAARKR